MIGDLGLVVGTDRAGRVTAPGVRRAVFALATAVAVPVLLVGCGADEPTPTTGERVQVAGGEALVWGRGGPGVVLAHGASFDAASWEDQASEMAGSGLSVLAVEDLTADAVAGGVAYLRDERGARSVSLLGSSAGAAPVLEVATGDQPPAGVVLLSPAGGEVEELRAPTFVVLSEDEDLADDITALAEAAGTTDVLAVPGDAHGQGIFGTESGDDALDAIIEHLRGW